ncbi:hypothetical protein A0H81_13752 [Grifola frondosa]|uniref:Uncharacterized protein n=1 Tax=Grifola frondosa TaxID=5627 RepID=A0A1C7LQB8_GRIFR|nr:hypothetical protein A0H81_13752 [Grifola frondosa]
MSCWDYCLRRLGSVIVTKQARTVIKGVLEEDALRSQLTLSTFSLLQLDPAPHIRHDYDVLHRIVAAYLSK